MKLKITTKFLGDDPDLTKALFLLFGILIVAVPLSIFLYGVLRFIIVK